MKVPNEVHSALVSPPLRNLAKINLLCTQTNNHMEKILLFFLPTTNLWTFSTPKSNKNGKSYIIHPPTFDLKGNSKYLICKLNLKLSTKKGRLKPRSKQPVVEGVISSENISQYVRYWNSERNAMRNGIRLEAKVTRPLHNLFTIKILQNRLLHTKAQSLVLFSFVTKL